VSDEDPDKKTPDTAATDVGSSDADDDVESDPARHTEGADDGVDWSDEGGATPSGPADTGDQTQ
jgi:hypothetical protein